MLFNRREETPPEGIEDQYYDGGYAPYPEASQQRFGRTGWDVLASSKKFILAVVLLIGSVALGIVLVQKADFAQLVSTLSAIAVYLPILLALPAGWVFCGFIFDKMYKPVGSFILYTDVEQGRICLKHVPEFRFRQLAQEGMTISLHTDSGAPIYLASCVDDDHIDFGWYHTERPEVVLANRTAFIRWRDMARDALTDNLMLVANPEILAAEMTSVALRGMLDNIAEALHLRVERGMDPAPEPEYDPVDESEGFDDQTIYATGGGL